MTDFVRYPIAFQFSNGIQFFEQWLENMENISLNHSSLFPTFEKTYLFFQLFYQTDLK